MHVIARPIAAALLALLCMLHLGSAQAQGGDAWPNRPITLLVRAAAHEELGPIQEHREQRPADLEQDRAGCGHHTGVSTPH